MALVPFYIKNLASYKAGKPTEDLAGRWAWSES